MIKTGEKESAKTKDKMEAKTIIVIGFIVLVFFSDYILLLIVMIFVLIMDLIQGVFDLLKSLKK